MDTAVNTSRSDAILRHIGDPLLFHPRAPISSPEAVQEKKQLHLQLTQLGKGLSEPDQKLISIAADLALFAHCNGYRGGIGSRHSLSHLFEVGTRTAERLPTDSKLSHLICGEVGGCSDYAVGIATAILHDSIEDFYLNLKSSSLTVSRDECDAFIQGYLRQRLTDTCGVKVADAVISRVQILTLPNQVEVASTKYIEGILSDLITTAVKAGDLTHNFQTFPGYSTVYPILMTAAQYGRYSKEFGIDFAGATTEFLLQSNLDEPCPWAKSGTTFDQTVESLIKVEGVQAIDRAYRYLRVLQNRGMREALNTKADEMISRLARVIDASPYRPEVTASSVSVENEASIAIRSVGPITDWSSVTRIPNRPGNRKILEDSILAATAKTGLHMPGYIIEGDNHIWFTMARLPRRVDEEVALISNFERVTRELRNELNARGALVLESSMAVWRPTLRAVVGLSEGYAEQRKDDIVRRIQQEIISDLDTAKAVALRTIGNDTLQRFGIDLDRFADLGELQKVLESTRMTKDHTVREVLSLLQGSGASVRAGMIYSAKARPPGEPGQPRLYTEACAIIDCDVSEENIARLVSIGSKLGQARFSLQDGNALTAVYLEILSHCDTPSATMS